MSRRNDALSGFQDKGCTIKGLVAAIVEDRVFGPAKRSGDRLLSTVP